MKNALILIRGLPGSGKSTLAKKLKKGKRGWKHFEADTYHMVGGKYRFDPSNLRAAHAWCLDSAIEALDAGHTVIVSNTFTTYREMEPYLEAASNCGIDARVIHCDSDYGSIHNVPDEAMNRMAARWEDFDDEELYVDGKFE